MIMWLTAAGSSVLARDSDVWNQGELVLMNGTELKGDIDYNWKAGVVQYREGNKIRAYSAYQVRAFRYFDDHQNVLRKFVTFDYADKSGSRQRPLFLEEVVMGSLPVYREVRSVHEPIKLKNLSMFNSDKELVKDLANFTYLVLLNGELINLNLFYRAMWPALKEKYEAELNRYAMRIQSDIAPTLLQLMLINQYNYLTQHQTEEQESNRPVGRE
ncbi:hypothetical protein SD10_21770 [Spirosoma radiotolerans]|uniref:Uncharacterized protein n=2 Tax=Spirosoma radiotolerans TaxID=1379870 RepID=A0A0E3ZXJ4_9BACT|nr:hypothetical protein SD10_21770 [Spirosoma radiotolerans]